MPTIPKLVAAICLSITAYLVSKMVMQVMPESTNFGIFLPLNMVIGFLTGWFYTGRLATTRLAEAVSYGLTGAAVMTFLALFTQSSNEMMRLAMRHRYGGPVEAVAAVFQIGVDFAAEVFTTDMVVTLAVGGIVAGVLTLLASKRWK
ncbi:TrgA family protein [Phaeobacter sp. J2-8]|uniref:TrgA family protein n=1 Tax=Phaeobacter sp. J2-8 TaxID=2931394 RepID=UPI001FD41F91|nr:TrgA family protein [Phaeobacter sp. J2-8]MCJ7872171.1 TrgA family protein [Phaeobacter sp. J2-8]